VKGIAGLVETVLKDSEANSGDRCVLSIDELFAALRLQRQDAVLTELVRRCETEPVNPQLRIAVERATQFAYEHFDKKLKRYGDTGKLQPEELSRIRNALMDLISDCGDGGPAQPDFQYLKAHWPDLEWEDYRKKYRARFEYLREEAQKRFAQAFAEEYGE
jgi:hypothetical protein